MSTWPLKLFTNKFPKWATNSARTLEPTEGDKLDGWHLSECAPARLMNWLQNITYRWLQEMAASHVSNWYNVKLTSDIVPGDILCGTYSDLAGCWLFLLVANSGGTLIAVRTVTGAEWELQDIGPSPVELVNTEGHVLTSNAQGFAIATRSGNIYSSDDGASGWASADSGPHDLGWDNLRGLRSKGTSSNFMVTWSFSGSNSHVMFAEDGHGTNWQEATTAFTTIQLRDLVYGGGSVWYAIATNGNTYCSQDDCDTWTLRGNFASLFPAESTLTPRRLSYDSDLGILTLVGGYSIDEGSTYSPMCIYSVDAGYTWALSTLHIQALTYNNSPIVDIIPCGAGVFVAVGTAFDVYLNTILVSVDGGLNFYSVTYFFTFEDDPICEELRCVVSNGKYLLSAGLTGFMIRTNAMLGSGIETVSAEISGE